MQQKRPVPKSGRNGCIAMRNPLYKANAWWVLLVTCMKPDAETIRWTGGRRLLAIWSASLSYARTRSSKAVQMSRMAASPRPSDLSVHAFRCSPWRGASDAAGAKIRANLLAPASDRLLLYLTRVDLSARELAGRTDIDLHQV